MATQVTNYQCPACTGPLQFSPETGKLECEYCGSGYSVEEVEALYAAKNEKAKAQADVADSQWGEDAAKMRAYSCPSCGAELICDETTAATSCPYCGNPTVVPGQFSDERKPDYVIPFRMDKEQAMDALRRHYKGKPLLPKAFASENHIQDIKGVYVPFWLFDGKAAADVTFEATRSRTTTTPNERITTTEHYQVRRAGTVEFERVPVDGSTKMPDAHMDAIEPYDYEQLEPFSLSYLPGFLAERYDVNAEESAKRADERCRNSAVDAMRQSVSGYDTCSVRHSNVQLSREEAKYALMPVWMLSTKWGEDSYLFAMNGQTGKLVGDLPISKGKLAAWFAGILIALSALCMLWMELGPALLVGVFVAVFVCVILAGMMKSAAEQTDADQYIQTGGIIITGRSDRFVHRTVRRQPIERNNHPRGK